MTYPDALPHDPPKQVAEDLFVVYGCVKTNAFVRFTRNMTVVRDNGQLTLINPVRMDEVGLAALEALGDVAHVLRMGFAHGMDDPFYVDRYQTSFWSFEGGKSYTEPAITHVLSEGGPLPFANARLMQFGHMRQPEGAILLERNPGVLLTTDAIQSYLTPPHSPHTNWLARRMLPILGFPKETLIGPIWMKLAVSDHAGIKSDFERLLDWDYDQLLAAHGTFLPANAKAEVRHAIDKFYSD